MIRLLTTLILVLLTRAQAWAHPHVWADYTARVTSTGDRIMTLHLEFTLDSMYSMVVRSEVIMNDTERSLQQKTIQAAGADIFTDNPVQLLLTVDGGPPVSSVLAITTDRRTADGAYVADIDLPANAKSVSFTVYDPTYYVAVALKTNQQAVTTAGPLVCDSERVTMAETVWGWLRADRVSCRLENGAAEKD